MKSYSSREVIGILKKDGWYEVACVGDHNKDIPIKTLRSISKQSGVMFP